MAVLCICLSSCSKDELVAIDTHEQEVILRASEVMNVSYNDSSGTSHSVDCTETSVSYTNSSSSEIIFTYQDGSTQTVQGNDIEFTSLAGDLLVTKDVTTEITTSSFDLESCRDECCYSYNNGNNVGVGLNFIVEEEPTGM